MVLFLASSGHDQLLEISATLEPSSQHQLSSAEQDTYNELLALYDEVCATG